MRRLLLILFAMTLATGIHTVTLAQGNGPVNRESDAAGASAGDRLIPLAGPFGPITNLRTSYTPVGTTSVSSPGQIFFQTGFEESWTYGAPVGWTGLLSNSDSTWHRSDFTTGWTFANGTGAFAGYVPSLMGTYSARFHSVNAPLNTRGYIITPTIDLSSATDSVFVSFWWENQTGTDTMRVYVSADGGSTFPYLVGWVGPTGGPWYQARGYVPGSSATTRIKFEVTSDAGMDDINLDEVAVYQRGPGFAGVLTLPGTFSSFTDAARKLSLFGVTAPVTINVASGTYADSVTFTPIPGASATNTITFAAAGGPVSVQCTGGTRNDDYVIGLWGADYLTFDGIGVSGGALVETGYYVRALTPADGANNNTIKNCTILMSRLNTSSHGIRHTPFWALTDQSGASSNNHYYNNDIESCGFRGILVQGAAPYLDENNEVASVGTGTARFFNIGATTLSVNAVGVSGQDGIRIHHVVVDSMTATTGTVTAILLGTGTTGGDSVVNFEVYDNNISRLSHTGGSASNILSAIRVPGHNNALRGRIYNNMVSNLRTNGTSANAIDALYHQGGIATFVEWHYNTVLLSNDSIGTNGGNVLFRFDAGTATVRNNLFVNKSAQKGTGKNYIYNRTGGTIISSNNAIFIDTTLTSRFVGSYSGDRLTLAAWQSAASNLDVQSVFTNPVFVNSTSLPYDLHINPSTATAIESGGVNVTGITSDYDGDPRAVGPATARPASNVNAAPDIGADEFNGTPADVVPPLIQYPALANGSVPSNRSLTATITDAASGVDQRPGLSPRVFYKKNGGSNWAGAFVDSAGVHAGNVWTFNINHSSLGGVTSGDSVYYYVAAGDSSGNVGTNPVGGAGSTPPPNPNVYRIFPTISGPVSIGTGGTFATLEAFFDSVNVSIVTGNIVASLVSNVTETATATLNAMAYGPGGPFSLLIRPSGGSRTDSCSIAGALIDFNGADYVTIDGSGKTLTLVNGNTGGQTILFRNDATYDTVRSCIIKGSNPSATSGTIVFSASAAPLGGISGNRYNSLEINDIRDGASVPANSIYSSGSGAPALNSYNSITGNNIFDFTASGVNVAGTGNGSGWTISNNSLFDQGSPSTAQTAIEFQPGLANSNLFTVGNTISGNFIGGKEPLAGGGPWTNSGAVVWKGIHCSTGAVAPTVISNNTIQNILLNPTSNVVVTNAFYGLHLDAGAMTVTGNTLGHPTTPSSIVTGVAGIFHGIATTTAATSAPWPTIIISRNILANIVQTSDTNSIVHALRGIEAGSSSATVIVDSNQIHDLYSACTNTNNQGGSAALIGIVLSMGTISSANPGNTIAIGNDVHTLALTSTKPVRNNVVGIGISNMQGETKGNLIYDLRNASTRNDSNSAPTCTGLYVRAVGVAATPDAVHYIYNNMIRLGSGQSTNTQFMGFYSNFDETAGLDGKFLVYNNSVAITGTAASGLNPSFCFLRGDTAYTMTRTAIFVARNNIFYNVRNGGTGKHYAIANRGTSAATNWGPRQFDYNLVYTGNPATVGLWGTGGDLTFAGWRGSSAGDSNSVYGNPQFMDSTADLHINTSAAVPSPAANRGITVGGLSGAIANDLDGDVRKATPDLGADEFSLRQPVAFTLLTPSAGASGQPLAGTLTWQSAPGASAYDVYLDTKTPPTALVSTGQTGTSFAYSVSQERKTFYWNIVAKNVDSTRAAGNGPYSFTTIAAGFSANPTSLSFGGVKINSTSKDSVTVTNNGTATLVIDSVKSNNTQFSVTPSGAIIFPQESAKFYVTFAPTSVGPKNGSLVFFHNGITVHDTLLVAGTGLPAVSVSEEENLPKAFALDQNWPNPFNPSTQIRFALPRQSSVSIEVFNMLGQEVVTLIGGEKAAGYYTVVWNGRNQFGSQAASGVYFIRMTAKGDNAETFSALRKIVLMK